MPDNVKPAPKIQHPGLTATIRKSDGNKGRFYTATPGRRYKKGEARQDRDRFSENDLMLAEPRPEAQRGVRHAEPVERQAA